MIFLHKISSTILFTFLLQYSLTQSLSINSGVDTISVDKKQVAQLWQNYLRSNPDSIYNNPHWSEADKKINRVDLIRTAFFNPSLYYFNFSNEILSIKKIEEQTYRVQSLFYWANHVDSLNVMSVANVVAVKQGQKFVLTNYQPYYVREHGYKTKTVERINYVYHPSHRFDYQKAKRAVSFLQHISNLFAITIPSFTYFIGKDCEEIFHLQGFDYVAGMGNQDVCGFADLAHTIIYATSHDGENHYHELCHFINNKFRNAHELLLVGMSAYLGGKSAHAGKPILYSIEKLNAYRQQHSAFSMQDICHLSILDKTFNPDYPVFAILCHEAYKQGGIENLKSLLNCGKTDEALYAGIEQYVHIKPSDLDTFLKKRIREISLSSENIGFTF